MFDRVVDETTNATVSDNPQDADEIEYLTRAYYQCLLYTTAPALPMFVIAGKMRPDRTQPTEEKMRVTQHSCSESIPCHRSHNKKQRVHKRGPPPK